MANQFISTPSTFKRIPLRWCAGLAVAILALVSVLPMHAESRAIKSRIQPTYPEMAKRMRITGTVRISATVAADGSVTAVKTVSGNAMLSHAAEDAVSRWKFAPGDAESTVEVDINFAGAN